MNYNSNNNNQCATYYLKFMVKINLKMRMNMRKIFVEIIVHAIQKKKFLNNSILSLISEKRMWLCTNN